MKEFWINRFMKVIETERNPCGCCPDTYDMTRVYDLRKPTVQTVHIGYKSRKALFKLMRSQGFEKL